MLKKNMHNLTVQSVISLTKSIRTSALHGNINCSRNFAKTSAHQTLQDARTNRQKNKLILNQEQQIFNSLIGVRWIHSKFDDVKKPKLNEESARDLICSLSESELDAIKTALDNYQSCQIKKDFEGKLAATQWRTRFGRLTRVPPLGDVDPTGSFCAVPDDWLQKKLAEKAKQPSVKDLWKIFSVNAVPFVVFGFLDNFTMIVSGDYIESAMGVVMSISTMTAAGLGNTISDILGLGSAVYVERGCKLIGLKSPDLTPAQFELKSSRRATNWGRIVGITIGCFLGMTPLLLRSDDHDDKDGEN